MCGKKLVMVWALQNVWQAPFLKVSALNDEEQVSMKCLGPHFLNTESRIIGNQCLSISHPIINRC